MDFGEDGWQCPDNILTGAVAGEGRSLTLQPVEGDAEIGGLRFPEACSD